MNPTKIILGLVPFAMFSLLASVIPTGWAALLGVLPAIVMIAMDARTGIKALPVASAVMLAALSLIAFTAGHEASSVIGAYGRGLGTLLLAGYILITAGFAPFTAAYARETTPREYWGSATFNAVNRRISLAWGGAVLLMAVGHILAAAIAADGSVRPIVLVVLNWGIPVAAIVATVKYTVRTVAETTTHTATAKP